MRKYFLFFVLILLVSCNNNDNPQDTVAHSENYTEVTELENFDIYKLITEYSGIENFDYSDWYIINEHEVDINGDLQPDFVIHIKQKETEELSEGILFIALHENINSYTLHTAIKYKPIENYMLTKINVENDEIKINVVNEEPYFTFYKHYSFKYMTDDFYLINLDCKTTETDSKLEFDEHFDFITKELKIINHTDDEIIKEELEPFNKEIARLSDIDLILYNPYE